MKMIDMARKGWSERVKGEPELPASTAPHALVLSGRRRYSNSEIYVHEFIFHSWLRCFETNSDSGEYKNLHP